MAGDLADLEFDGALGDGAEGGGGDDVVRVDEAAQCLVLRGLRRVHCGLELRAEPDAQVAGQVGDEARAHHRAVLVGDAGVGDDVRQVAVRGGEEGERRGEEEELDAVGAVVAEDLAEDGERRVVHDHAPGWVLVEPLVVTAGEERPHHFAPCHVPGLADEAEHRVVDGRGGVAVVRGELRLELLQELVVAFHAFAALAGECVGCLHLSKSW